MLGEEGLARLQNSFVVVVGLGAVGSYATEALARSGVGKLRLIDFDEVNESNINRQLYALHSTIGRGKAELAAERVRDINPDCIIENSNTFVHADTLDEVLADNPDVVIDAIDSLNPKVALLAGTVERGFKVFSSMGAALRRDPSKIIMSDIAKTMNCPLARLVRKRLRRYHDIKKGITCVSSTELAPEASEASMEEDKTPYTGRGRARPALGSLSTITGIFGLTLATAVIEYLVENKKQ